ncbi:MAG: hypothetical protein IJC93_02570 [Clostridia bacterium]|nr:hypothetical protein [Clostridia bacterium]
MNTHNLEKLDVYKHGSIWFRIYMFGYLYGFLIAYSVVMLGFLSSQEMWLDIIHTWSGKESTYAGVHSICSVILVASAVINAALMPMVNKWAYIATMTHLLVLLTHRPLIFVLTKIFVGPLPESFGNYTSFLLPIAVVFVVPNLWYFFRRRDLFTKDIVKIVTGQEKDEITSEFR